jgi:hypothetical protein
LSGRSQTLARVATLAPADQHRPPARCQSVPASLRSNRLHRGVELGDARFDVGLDQLKRALADLLQVDHLLVEIVSRGGRSFANVVTIRWAASAFISSLERAGKAADNRAIQQISVIARVVEWN